MFRISINGFGRIGRTFLRNALSENLNVVAINDLAPPSTLAHLFKYDSVHGLFNGEVSSDEQAIYVNGIKIEVFNQPNTELIPWNNIHLVIESTGKNLDYDRASKHLKAGAKQVLVSAPAADNIPMVVLGVNNAAQIIEAPVFSAASCTTNNIAPILKVLHEKWEVKEGYITTVHSMTGDQNLHDAPHHDLRRARAAGSSIIPTTTGAAKAITKIFPDLEKKLGGAGIRVPVLNGSLTDLTCILNKKATVQEINEEIRIQSETNLKGIVEYINEPIVSVDILNNRHSCIFDAQLTSVVGDLVKVVGWYDNESGYSSRLVDLAKMVKKKYD